MTIAEFIEQLKKYPQDMKISFGEDSDWIEKVVLIFGQAETGEAKELPRSKPNLIAKFDEDKGEMVWTDPKTFQSKFDAHVLVDDLKCAIIMQKNSNGEFLTGVEALAYLNNLDAIAINLNKEIKNDIQSN